MPPCPKGGSLGARLQGLCAGVESLSLPSSTGEGQALVSGRDVSRDQIGLFER